MGGTFILYVHTYLLTVSIFSAIPAAEEEEEGEKAAANNKPKENLYPPLCLRSVLWKIDMSFLDDSNLLMTLLSAGLYAHLNEMKFVQSPAVTDQFLLTVAKVYCMYIVSYKCRISQNTI